MYWFAVVTLLGVDKIAVCAKMDYCAATDELECELHFSMADQAHVVRRFERDVSAAYPVVLHGEAGDCAVDLYCQPAYMPFLRRLDILSDLCTMDWRNVTELASQN